MKIIDNKRKDYYDYLQGVFGVDEKLILDRRDFKAPFIGSGDEVIRLHICGYMYEGLKKDDKFYWGDQCEQFAVERPKSRWWNWRGGNDTKEEEGNSWYVPIIDTLGKQGFVHIPKSNFRMKSTINDKYDCPIMKYDLFGNIDGKFIKFPRLADFNFGSRLSPEEIWIELSNWLSKTKEIPDTMTDKDKIIAAGFDLKTSFRKDKEEK